MNGASKLVHLGLAVCLSGAASLGAQDTGFSKDFKFRLGYAPSAKDHLRAPYSGIGFNVGYGIGVGRIGLELGYLYNTGDDYFTSPDDSRLPQGALPMNPAKSVEDKRNQFAGFTVRASFSQQFAPRWRWQAGLQFGGSFRHQYVGDCQSTPWDVNSGDAAWRDFYLGVPQKGGLNPSPYAGFVWKADRDSTVEINVLFQNYTAMEYHHYAGTAATYLTGAPGRRSEDNGTFPYDALVENRRLVPHLEIAYAFTF